MINPRISPNCNTSTMTGATYSMVIPETRN